MTSSNSSINTDASCPDHIPVIIPNVSDSQNTDRKVAETIDGVNCGPLPLLESKQVGYFELGSPIQNPEEMDLILRSFSESHFTDLVQTPMPINEKDLLICLDSVMQEKRYTTELNRTSNTNCSCLNLGSVQVPPNAVSEVEKLTDDLFPFNSTNCAAIGEKIQTSSIQPDIVVYQQQASVQLNSYMEYQKALDLPEKRIIFDPQNIVGDLMKKKQSEEEGHEIVPSFRNLQFVEEFMKKLYCLLFERLKIKCTDSYLTFRSQDCETVDGADSSQTQHTIMSENRLKKFVIQLVKGNESIENITIEGVLKEIVDEKGLKHACRHCGALFSHRYDMVKHETNRLKKSLPYVCIYRNCSRLHSSFRDLLDHYRHRHNGNCPTLGFKGFFCLDCGLLVDLETKFITHRFIAHGVPKNTLVPSPCRVNKCGRTFLSSEDFYNHGKYFHDHAEVDPNTPCCQVPKILECPEKGCDMVFKTSTKLSNHVKIIHR